MTWLGGPYWICGRSRCNTVYVQQKPWFPPGWQPKYPSQVTQEKNDG